MHYLPLGYFLAYMPYALLAKALSSGIIPGIDAPVGGLVLLPASAIGKRFGLISTIGFGAGVAGVGGAAALFLTEPARPRARTLAAAGSIDARRWIGALLRPDTEGGARLEVRGAW